MSVLLGINIQQKCMRHIVSGKQTLETTVTTAEILNALGWVYVICLIANQLIYLSEIHKCV